MNWDLTDNLGSLRIVLSNTSNIIDEIVYNSFGQVAYESNPSAAHFAGFEGGHVDATTGIVNDYHRWYDPSIGKWLSEDPLTFAAGDEDLTRYVGNDPTGLTDNTGLFPGGGRPLGPNPTPIELGTMYMQWAAQMAVEAHQGAPIPYSPQVKWYLSGTYSYYQSVLIEHLTQQQYSLAQLVNWHIQVTSTIRGLEAALEAARQARIKYRQNMDEVNAIKQVRLMQTIANQRQLLLATQQALMMVMQSQQIEMQMNERNHQQ